MLKLKDIENDERISEKAKDLLMLSLDINNVKSKPVLDMLKEVLPAKLNNDYSEQTISNVLTLKPEKLLEYILKSDAPDFKANYDKINSFNNLLNIKLRIKIDMMNLRHPMFKDTYYCYGKEINNIEAFDYIKKSVYKTSIIDNGETFRIIKKFGISKANIKCFLKDSSKENRVKAFNDEIFMINLLNYIYLDKTQSIIEKYWNSFDSSYKNKLNNLESKYLAPIATINNKATGSIPKYNIEVGFDININEIYEKNLIDCVANNLLGVCSAMLILGFN